MSQIATTVMPTFTGQRTPTGRRRWRARRRLRENGRGMVEDGVDAGILLKKGSPNPKIINLAHPAGEATRARRTGALLPETRRMLSNSRSAAAARAPTPERPARFAHGTCSTATWGSRTTAATGSMRLRDGLYTQHPAPALRPERQQEVVGKERDGDPDDNHQLIEGDEAAARARRGRTPRYRPVP